MTAVHRIYERTRDTPKAAVLVNLSGLLQRLFNDAGNNSERAASNGGMIGEQWERIRKETVTA
jgi:hypothetical protein